ncbi:MAG TPA: hypothetical protein VL331_10040 [Croceibacterium sp.]|nr:hypothetical protein [Croceibacterium sp.]
MTASTWSSCPDRDLLGDHAVQLRIDAVRLDGDGDEPPDGVRDRHRVDPG